MKVLEFADDEGAVDFSVAVPDESAVEERGLEVCFVGISNHLNETMFSMKLSSIRSEALATKCYVIRCAVNRCAVNRCAQGRN